MTDEQLRALSERATQGEWAVHSAFYPHGTKGDVFAKDARDVYDATPICRVVAPISHRETKRIGKAICALQETVRRKSQSPIIEANAAFITALVNAYRSGDLVPRATGDVEVTQADRDAAASVYKALLPSTDMRPTNATLGNMDDLHTVQAFARHRNQEPDQ